MKFYASWTKKKLCIKNATWFFYVVLLKLATKLLLEVALEKKYLSENFSQKAQTLDKHQLFKNSNASKKPLGCSNVNKLLGDRKIPLL